MLVQVVVGTTRPGRFSERVAGWVIERLSARPDVEVELIDLRDHQLPFFTGDPPAKAPRAYPDDAVARLGQTLDRADGYVLLVAEYNHGYPAVLKNAMDWTFVEWRRKPVAFVGWGNVGGARAIEQLRLVSVEYEMAPLRHAVHILPAQMIAANQGEAEPFSSLDSRLTLLADDLLWWTRTLAVGRADTGPDD